MLYDTDINNLLSEWNERLGLSGNSQSYKDALSECIFDLKCAVNKNFEEEALANEAFEQRLEDTERDWEAYFNNLVRNGIFA